MRSNNHHTNPTMTHDVAIAISFLRAYNGLIRRWWRDQEYHDPTATTVRVIARRVMPTPFRIDAK